MQFTSLRSALIAHPRSLRHFIGKNLHSLPGMLVRNKKVSQAQPTRLKSSDAEFTRVSGGKCSAPSRFPIALHCLRVCRASGLLLGWTELEFKKARIHEMSGYKDTRIGYEGRILDSSLMLRDFDNKLQYFN
ncbi:hypothetical protein ABKN59_005065 [Abortiporus biennis]